MKEPLFKRLNSKLILFTSLSFSFSYTFSQVAEFSKSYINITKGTNGGTIESGNVLEIRAMFAVRSGSFDSCAYYDVIPAGTAYVPNSLSILTNEGKIFKQFTDALNDDAAWRSGNTIRINLGYNATSSYATAYRRGTVASTHKPAYFTNGCIMVASFRVTITAISGTNISVGSGNITLKNGANPIQTYTFQPNLVRVYPNYGLGTGVTGANLFTTESNGTFGNGKPRNRASSSFVPPSYSYQVLNNGSPVDNAYGIANNTSARSNYTTVNSWPNPDTNSPSHRVFGVWDIIGDHTGAASPALGNSAADTVSNNNGGYMLVVNSAYKSDSAFQATVNGLCPNTLYEITCWFRNVCPKCGCDSNGKAATDASGPVFYIPTASGDSSGIPPNLIFEINGIDYYTTGNISYSGQWVRKGFSFLTGSSQISFTIRIFNNAPAGSGNDWAMDDITVSGVAPVMNYAPAINSLVCENNSITIYDTIRSAAGNYVYYQWQRSTNGGNSWTDITTPQGPVVPYQNGTTWEYVASYNITPSSTDPSDSGDLYRIIVSGTSTNLSNSSCSFAEDTFVTLNVINCGVPLDVDLLSFSGFVKANMVTLHWSTSKEEEPLKFDIEKSINNSAFEVVHSVDGSNNGPDVVNNYSWTDPDILKTKVYYRLKIYNRLGKLKYSRIIVFTTITNLFDLVSIDNPFGSVLQFGVYADRNRMLDVKLFDVSGKIVRTTSSSLTKGTNTLRMNNASSLAPGIYILALYSNGEMIQRKILKQ